MVWIAVVGASGMFGGALARAVLRQGHSLLAVSRPLGDKPSAAGARLKAIQALAEALGASVRVEFVDYSDTAGLTKAFEGCQAVVVSLSGTSKLIPIEKGIFLAAKAAGVKRFIPNEFGIHTQSMKDVDEYVIHRLKRKFMDEDVKPSGVEWTIVYPGYIFYYQPNLTVYKKLPIFGDPDLKIQTHHADDIGMVAIMAALDPRCANHCVQISVNAYTQKELIETVKEVYPDLKDREVEFTPSETLFKSLAEAKEHTGKELVSDVGGETEFERVQINIACFVKGYLNVQGDPKDSKTLFAHELFPDYKFLTWKDFCLQNEDFIRGKLTWDAFLEMTFDVKK